MKAHRDQTYEKALRSALRLLRYRDRSEFEIRSKLADLDGKVTDDVIAELYRLSYLDDARVAEGIFLDATEKSLFGPLMLEHKFVKIGLSSTLLELHLSSFNGQLELETAQKCLQARKGRNSPQSAASFLGRKGFREEAIEAAIVAHFDLEYP